MARLTRRIKSALKTADLKRSDVQPLASVNLLHLNAEAVTPGLKSDPAIAGNPANPASRARGRRTKSGLPTSLQSWDELEAAVGMPLISDFKRAADAAGGKVSENHRAARHFLGSLLRQAETEASGTLRLLQRCAAGKDEPQAPAHSQITAAINDWMIRTSSEGVLSGTTLEGYTLCLARTLAKLGTFQDRTYPPFDRKEVTIPSGAGTVLSIGSLGWPEFAGLATAAKERQGLEIVARAASDELRRAEAIFDFGQDTLARTAVPPHAHAGSWNLIKRLLHEEQDSWNASGFSRFHPSVPSNSRRLEIMQTLASRDVWLAAGLTPEIGNSLFKQAKRQGRFRLLSQLCCGCLGPTRKMTIAAQAALCVGTGWNRQPIVDLPRDPYLLKTRDSIALVSSSFLQSFKRRAKHAVLSHLEHDRLVEGLMQDAALAEWRAVAAATDPNGSGDGYALIKIGTSMGAQEALDRYERIADAARSFPSASPFESDFFFHISAPQGISKEADPLVAEFLEEQACDRPGASFQAIRKSFLILKLNEVGSVSGVAEFAGHRTLSTLMPHYLNTDDVKREFDESIRFFQNCLQSIVVRGHPRAAILLGISDQDLEWFSRLSKYSGLTAALSAAPGTSKTQVTPRKLTFDPTDENLLNLSLMRMSLRRARAATSARRWVVQGLPLLAVTQAVGLKVLNKGLSLSFKKSIRAAYALVRSNPDALPPVLAS